MGEGRRGWGPEGRMKEELVAGDAELQRQRVDGWMMMEGCYALCSLLSCRPRSVY